MISALQRRSREAKMLHFFRTIKPESHHTVLELGSGSGSYFLEHYPFRNKVTAVDHNTRLLDQLKEKYPEVTTLKLDLNKPLPFKDKSFDIIFSNAVIEHLAHQGQYAQEIERVGKKYFISCPNKHFPFEMHYRLPFFQYLPENLKRWIAKNFSFGPMKKGYYEQIRLLTARELAMMFPNGTVSSFFYTYNLLAIKA